MEAKEESTFGDAFFWLSSEHVFTWLCRFFSLRIHQHPFLWSFTTLLDPVVDRQRGVWGRKLCSQSLSFWFSAGNNFTRFRWFVLLRVPQHPVLWGLTTLLDSVQYVPTTLLVCWGISGKLWRCPCIASSDHHKSVFLFVDLQRQISLTKVYQAFS